MPSPMTIIPRLEGMLSGFSATYNQPDTAVAQFVEMCKMIMRMPANRDLTDWELFISTGSLTETEEAVYAAAATLYGVLGMCDGSNDDYIFSTYNAANPTVASTDLNDGGNLSSSFVVRNASASATNFGSVVLPGGLAHDTYLTIAASERDEGSVTASTAKAWVLYRTA